MLFNLQTKHEMNIVSISLDHANKIHRKLIEIFVSYRRKSYSKLPTFVAIR